MAAREATQSAEDAPGFPSTDKQKDLARILAAELQALVDSLKTTERRAFVTISCSSAMVCQAEFPPVPLDEIKSALKLNSSGYLRRDFSSYYLDAFELKKGTEGPKSKGKNPAKVEDAGKTKDATKAKEKETVKSTVLVGGATREEVDACRDALIAAKIKPTRSNWPLCPSSTHFKSAILRSRTKSLCLWTWARG